MSTVLSNVKSMPVIGTGSKKDLLDDEGRNGFTLYLIVDNRESYRETLSMHFSREDLVYISPEVLVGKPGNEIRELLLPATAVLFDWSTRSAGLLTTLRNSRCNSETPIMAVCGDQEADHVAALIMGADVTIRRPFNPIMLNAKLVAYRRSVREQNRHSIRGERADSAEPPDLSQNALDLQKPLDILTVGRLHLNEAARELYVDDRTVRLTPMEFDLLGLLMKHAGVCLKRDHIIDEIWGINYDTGTNFLDVHIHALRQKLRTAGLSPLISTVRGVGYRFEKHRCEFEI